MNSQSVPPTTYTLPGVMHYLQTEFTKNERDRISWELERCEMKARIAQLEGENRDLRYELFELRNVQNLKKPSNDTAIQEPLLLKSKLAVQENVKEIVYLLKSPSVTTQLESLSNMNDPTHKLEKLYINCGDNPSNLKQQHEQTDDKVARNIDESNLFLEQQTTALQEASQLDKAYESDLDTIVQEKSTSRSPSPISPKPQAEQNNRPRASSLFTTKSNAAAPNLVLRCRRIRYHLDAIDKLKISQHNILSYARDGLMKHWLIEPNLNCNDKLTKSFHGLASNVLDLYWLDSEKFFTVDNVGLKVWSINDNNPVVKLDIFSDDYENDFTFQDIQDVDFKNKWLVFSCSNSIYIRELVITAKEIKIEKKYVVKTACAVSDVILGITEKSLIVFYGDSYDIVIYNFQGEKLQVVKLKDVLSQSTLTKDDATKLFLNKESSKMLIQVGDTIAIYSFDQKKIILKQQLAHPPTSIVFRFSNDYVVLAYADGVIELRDITSFHKVLKKYNHYDDENEYADAEDVKQESATDDGVEGEHVGELKQNVHNGIIIDVTEVDSVPVIVSGGDDGMIRLEKLVEFA